MERRAQNCVTIIMGTSINPLNFGPRKFSLERYRVCANIDNRRCGQVWADSAYRSEEQEQSLKDSEHTSQINEHAYRGKPLSESQEISNKAKSREQARVEHVFGHMENSMGGIFVVSIGIAAPRLV